MFLSIFIHKEAAPGTAIRRACYRGIANSICRKQMQQHLHQNCCVLWQLGNRKERSCGLFQTSPAACRVGRSGIHRGLAAIRSSERENFANISQIILPESFAQLSLRVLSGWTFFLFCSHPRNPRLVQLIAGAHIELQWQGIVHITVAPLQMHSTTERKAFLCWIKGVNWVGFSSACAYYNCKGWLFTSTKKSFCQGLWLIMQRQCAKFL